MSLNYNGKKPVVDCSKDRGFTVQADRDEADINKIVARFEKGADIARINSREPFYGDVSELDGLQDALIKVQKANELFMEYNADLRERFDNDPTKLVDFLADEKNRAEAIELGLIDKPLPVPEPAAVPGAPVDPAK